MATSDLVRFAPGRIVQSRLTQTSSTSRKSPTTWLTLSLVQCTFDSKFTVIMQKNGQWHGRGIVASSSLLHPRQCQLFGRTSFARRRITSSINPSALLFFATDGTIWNMLDIVLQKLRGEAMPMTLQLHFRHKCLSSRNRCNMLKIPPGRKSITYPRMLILIFLQAIRAGIRHPHGDPHLRVQQLPGAPGLLT